MSAARTRMLGAIMASAAVVALAACGDGKDGKPEDNARPTPTASRTIESTPSAIEASTDYGTGLSVMTCAAVGGVQTLALHNYDNAGELVGTPREIDWQTQDLNTKSIGGCGSRYAEAGYSPDLKRLYVQRLDTAKRDYEIGFIDTETGGYTKLTPEVDELTKRSELAPSVNHANGRVYFYDVTGDDPVLKSVKVVGNKATDLRDESALHQQYDAAGPDFDGWTGGYKGSSYVISNKNGYAMAEADERSVLSLDGKRKASVEASSGYSTASDIVVSNGAKETTYAPVFPKGSEPKFGNNSLLGGWINDNSLVYSDGKQIFRADLQAGGKAVLKLIVPNTSAAIIRDLKLSDEGDKIAFVTDRTEGFGAIANKIDLYTVQLDGASRKIVETFTKKAVVGNTTIVSFSSK